MIPVLVGHLWPVIGTKTWLRPKNSRCKNKNLKNPPWRCSAILYYTCVLCCPLSMWAVRRSEDVITKPLLLNTVTVYEVWFCLTSWNTIIINLCIKSHQAKVLKYVNKRSCLKKVLQLVAQPSVQCSQCPGPGLLVLGPSGGGARDTRPVPTCSHRPPGPRGHHHYCRQLSNCYSSFKRRLNEGLRRFHNHREGPY